MKELLLGIKEYMEEAEEICDDEWGLSRSAYSLVNSGLMPDIYYDIVRKIEEYK